MLLYKNVDICDLESIMKNGILPLDKCKNDNWNCGRRSKNSTSVVYLFEPIENKSNTFPNYGIVLLEVDVDAREHQMSEYDAHRNDYKEYITSEVKPDQIKRVIIPSILKNRISVPKNIEITWCDLKAETYKSEKFEWHRGPATAEELELFAKTAPLNTGDFNFFRGVDENNDVIDLYDVKYVWQ